MRRLLYIVVDSMRKEEGEKLKKVLEREVPEGYVYGKIAIAPATWTLPVFASIFTGKMPEKHGIHEGRFKITDRKKIGFSVYVQKEWLPEKIQNKGVETTLITQNVVISDAFGFERGFTNYHYVDIFNEKGEIDKETYMDLLLDEVSHSSPPGKFILVEDMHLHKPYTEMKAIPSKYKLLKDEKLLKGVLPRIRNARKKDFERLQNSLPPVIREAVKNRYVVIISGDHGDALGEENYVFHGGPPYPQIALTYLIVVSPAVLHKLGECGGRYYRIVDVGNAIWDYFNFKAERFFIRGTNKGISQSFGTQHPKSYLKDLYESLNKKAVGKIENCYERLYIEGELYKTYKLC